MSDDHGFESHKHPAVVHEHYHWHVTHNFNEQAQAWVEATVERIRREKVGLEPASGAAVHPRG